MDKKIIIAVVIGLLLVFGILLFKNDNQEQDVQKESAGLTPATAFSHAHGLAVDVNDESQIYIATHQGLYLLKDDRDLYRVGESEDDLMGFSVHPDEARTFYSSGHPRGGGNLGFQRTTDGGQTWKQVSPGLNGPVDFHSMTVSAANSNIIYGFFSGKLQRSEDGGKTWVYTKSTVTPYSFSTDYHNENVVYAATPSGVEVSRDRGDTWSNLSTELSGSAASVLAPSPHDGNYMLVFSSRLGGLGKSTDGGVTWTKISESFNGESVLYISFGKNESNLTYALTNKNSLYKSVDKGETWVRIR